MQRPLLGLEKWFTGNQIYSVSVYESAMVLPIRMSTNMAAGNQQKYLSLSFSSKA